MLRHTALVIGWVALGALGAVGLLGIFTIGLVFLALTAPLTWLLVRRDPDRNCAPLIAIGACAVFAAFGVLSLPYRTCADTVVATPAHPDSGDCGGFHPAVYFVPAGLALMVALLTVATHRRH